MSYYKDSFELENIMITTASKSARSAAPKRKDPAGRVQLKKALSTAKPAAKRASRSTGQRELVSLKQGGDMSIWVTNQLIDSPSFSGSGMPMPDYKFVYDMQPVDRAYLVKRGVSSALARTISIDMGVTKDRFSQVTGMSISNIKRKISKNATEAERALSRAESESMVGLAKLIGQVKTIVNESGDSQGFNAAKWFGEWIEQPVKALGGQKPADLLDTADGRDAVSRLLAQMQSGAYA